MSIHLSNDFSVGYDLNKVKCENTSERATTNSHSYNSESEEEYPAIIHSSPSPLVHPAKCLRIIALKHLTTISFYSIWQPPKVS